MALRFLTASEASSEYRKTDYFAQMNYIELAFRLNTLGQAYKANESCDRLRSRLLKQYQSLTRSFTAYEKDVLRFYFRRLYEILNNKAPALIPNKANINLIKLAEGVDWDYPYTINHSIIIPTKFLRGLIDLYRQFHYQITQIPSQVWNPTRPQFETIDRKVAVLCHELIHIIQRNKTLYPAHNRILDYAYTQLWSFEPITKDQIRFRHANEAQYFNALTNPDGYNFQWIVPVYNHETNYNTLFLPLLSRSQDNRPIGVLVEVTKQGDNYLVGSHWNEIDKIKRYAQKFYGLNKQLYHPNEILCHLLSDYVILDTIWSDVDIDFGYRTFYALINEKFISRQYRPYQNR